MKTWLITGEGIWLYAYVLVCADDELEALQIAQGLLTEQGCSGIPHSVEEVELKPNSGYVIWNGDY